MKSNIFTNIFYIIIEFLSIIRLFLGVLIKKFYNNKIMDIKILLGRRIREYRTKAGLTQSQLAEKIGIDDKHLSNIERGKNMPNPTILCALAELFSIEIKDLFEFGHLQAPDDLKQEIIKMLDKFEAEELSMIYKYIRTFMI